MIRKLLALIPVMVIIAGCGSGPEPVGSATEAPGASKMPDPPQRSRPAPPGNGRGTGQLSSN